LQGFFQRYLMLHRSLINKLNELLGEYGLSYSLWMVVFYVKNNGPSSLVDISNYFNVEKPAITRTVQRLEEKRLVKQITSKDKREKIIQLTELGEEIYQACREKITQLEFRVMVGIPEDEQKAAFEMLPKIRETIINGDNKK
jgi:MarR family transcriptional regulator, transcriptional regulator for hemolysin